jgi:ATP-dependent helicase HrpA
VSTISIPSDLPIAERRDDLLAAISAHQVVVVAGETGSGKSTQLPKLCLELGRGTDAWIGHTQPRRIAARSIAERVAEELGTTVGDQVGYAVRFTDQVGPDTRIKLMTDGILLAEIQRDRLLRRYDTVIVDEAHERSLNIDFLLGYLRRLLPRRPDLKLIVTSATIDTERFSHHFDDAPVIEVSGRTYPVDVRYRPLVDPDSGDELDQTEGICRAVGELRRAGPGDVLVFCSGEREIRDAAQALRGLRFDDTEILPLYARLSAAEQHRVFQPHHGRRIVLATNVAETSLTVPGIRYVVDPGTARISRYSHRTKVQRLPIEAISQASANQRAGRCGRVAPGICIRLYDQDDFDQRPEFTEPEIQRTNLASVILQMAALGLGDIEAFPFVDPPDTRAVRDGIALLGELGAVDPTHEGTPRWLTPLGRRLAALPVDPRLGRMILEAAELGCLHEVMIIAAGLSIQDPRERPSGPDQPAAAQLHARFEVDGSDLLSFVALWDHLAELRRDRSSNQFRKQCKAEFLHVLRIREWQDLYAQLRQVCSRLGMRPNRRPAEPDTVHRALLTGLLSHVGMYTGTGRDYRGARNSRFTLARDALRGAGAPRWVMAAELVETNRIWAHGAARIQPQWIERAASHLVKVSHGEPQWDGAEANAVVSERVTLYGLPVVDGRTVQLSRIDPAEARRTFIDRALVDGDWDRRPEVLRRIDDARHDVETLAARARRDLLAPSDQLATFFDERIPDHVTSGSSFNRWWNRRRRRDPALLDVPREVLLDPAVRAVDWDAFPDEWRLGVDAPLLLTYVFDSDDPLDGLVVEVPVSLLGQLDPAVFTWHVDGMRLELVDALLRLLPKPVRRQLVPIPDTARELLDTLPTGSGDLGSALCAEVSRRTGQRIRPRDIDQSRLSTHLVPTFRIHDDDGTVLAVGTDLDELRNRLGADLRAALAEVHAGIEQDGLVEWPDGPLPRIVHTDGPGGHRVEAFPALVDQTGAVGVRLFASRADQAEAMWLGTRRLLQLRLPSAARALGRLPTASLRTAITASPYPDEEAWLGDLLAAVFDELMETHGAPAWDAPSFDRLRVAVRDDLGEVLSSAWTVATDILVRHQNVADALDDLPGPGFAEVRADVREHLERLVYPGMLTSVGLERLPDVSRYLTAIELRLSKLRDDPDRDRQRMALCRRLESDYDRVRARVSWSPEVDDTAWLLEELRVATFAQTLGTAVPVSEKRVWAALGRLDRE